MLSCETDAEEETLPVTAVVNRKGSLKRSKPKKKLRFNFDKNVVFPIPHLDNMTDEEVALIWYDSEEYSEIKSSYQLTIFRMESGELKEDDDHTSRGLEYRTQTGAWARYENKRDAYNAVLDEQDRQWKVDQDNDVEIGRVYLQHSTKCAVAAAERGAEDAKEAKEICQDLIKKRRTRRKKSKKLDKTEVEQAQAPPVRPPRAEQAKQLLRQQSFRRRELIRDDIVKQQAKAMKKDKRQICVAV